MTMSARQARHKKNLTLKQVSELTGISEPFLAQVERGERQIGAEHANKLAKVYGVPTNRIFLPTRYAVCEVSRQSM